MQKSTRNTLIAAVTIIVLCIVAMLTNNAGFDFWATNGIWSILPPLIAIVLAFITKNVIVSLLAGLFAGAFLVSLDYLNIATASIGMFTHSTKTMQSVLADEWNAGIILQVLAIGGLISLVTKLGGSQAIADKLVKYAKGPVSTQVVTWLMGLIIFFDDYANSLIVGPIMRPVTDKHGISRERLSFMIDATAAPVAGIALISTWIGAEISYINDGFGMAGITGESAYGLFVASIPYRFYNILMLAFVLVTAITLRERGPMLEAERRARLGDIRPADPDENDKVDESIATAMGGKSTNIWNAIVPLGALILGSFVGFYFNGRAAILGGDDMSLMAQIAANPLSFSTIQECFSASDASVVLFQASIFAGVIALAMGVIQKRFTLDEGLKVWVSGVKSLVITGVILILAWSLSSIIKELGTATFLVSMLSDTTPTFLLPSITFILGAIISFATGTSYGTMGILMPLAIPFAHAVMPGDYGYLVSVSAGVLAGAVFGDHCSPISDTTILSSMGADCSHVAHVNTQLPYSLAVAVVSVIFGYLPVGLGLPIWAAMPISLAAIVGMIFLFGKKVPPAAKKSPATR